MAQHDATRTADQFEFIISAENAAAVKARTQREVTARKTGSY